MNKLIWVFALVLAAHCACAQEGMTIKITDSRSAHPVAGATLDITGIGMLATGDSGSVFLKRIRPGNYRVRISAIGYKTQDGPLEFRNGSVTIPLEQIPLFLQPVEIRALRAGDKAPFTKTNLSKPAIAAANLGQNLPFLLNQTPSVVVNSDAGNGIGYTGIYIRGTDATRINMTLNGIPYNDAEDQSIYFVNLPDLASSVNSIQVQRGVGTSSNGAGAFGATINFSTNEFNDSAYAEVNTSAGSFNSLKNTIKVGTGLINDHFTIDTRFSRISSNGYIDRATSDLKSLYLSTAYYSRHSSLRFNILLGNEKTYQAWNGIPEAKLNGDRAALDVHYANNAGSLYLTRADSVNLYDAGNRTYNYFTYKNQTDNYRQNHYQLFFNHQYNPLLSFNAAAFLTRGLGYYEEYKTQAAYADYGLPVPVAGGDSISHTDLIRQLWLDNYFYGGIFSAQYKNGGTQFTAGGGWDRYDGKHYGIITWSENGGIPDHYTWYNVGAFKRDVNGYVKLQQQLGDKWTAFGDLQYRDLYYHIGGFQDNPSLVINTAYHFLNPKAGLTYTAHDWKGYLSYSLAHHEPNRDDFESSPGQQPKAETLQDVEMGMEKKNALFSYGLTGYYMQYRNQLVLNGKINSVGEYTRVNIPDSYRLGVELQGSARITRWIQVEGNLALSRNKVRNYTEYIDDYDDGTQKDFHYASKNIAFSPAVVGGCTVRVFPVTNGEINLIGKYVSRSYLDNTQQENRSLKGYYVQDLRMRYTLKGSWIKETDLILQVNNAFNKKYAPNGYTYSYVYGGQLITENFLFPMAVTNVMLAVNIRL